MNGKPGDDPLLDILRHKRPVYSPEVDALVVKLADLYSLDDLREVADWGHPPPLEKFREDLEGLLASRRDEARDRGWDV